MPKKLDNELMEYKEKIGAMNLKCSMTGCIRKLKEKKRFSGEVYTNSPSKINAIRDKYKNGVTDKILSELYI